VLKLKSSSSWAVIAALTVGIGGCAVGPNFERPAAPATDTYTATPLSSQTTSADTPGGAAQKFTQGEDVPGDWWKVFRSDAFNSLIEEALKANPDLQSAQASLREAFATADASFGALVPSVSASGSLSRSGTAGDTTPPSRTNSLFGASVSVSYIFDIWGGERRSYESSQASAENTKYQTEATYLSLTGNVLTTAISVASLTSQIKATEEILADQQKTLDLLNQQFDLGAVAKGDVLTQRSEVASTQASLPSLRKQLSQAQNSLAVLLGRLPNHQDYPLVDLDTLYLPEDLPVTVPSKLVEQRPDIRASEASLHQASANVGVAIANLLPSINLSGSFNSNSGSSIADLFGPASTWSLASSLTQPIFKGGQLMNQKKAAIASYDHAAASYKSTVLSAFKDVANALQALQLDADTVKAQLYSEQTSSESLNITRERYNAGAISTLDLLTAERTYQSAKISLVQARATRYSDTVALFQALGGGWWNRNDTQVALEAPTPSPTPEAPSTP
jgi:NodT family efflux transporter outer membrane factor (OMF) lipoprotein